MPRAPCIDRTLTVTEADVIVLDLKRRRNMEKKLYIPRAYQDPVNLLRALRKTWPDPDTIPVHVLQQKSFKRSFHMTETEFINYIIEKEKSQNAENNH